MIKTLTPPITAAVISILSLPTTYLGERSLKNEKKNKVNWFFMKINWKHDL